jgi:actin-like ATPase involved in cell morphogenesis
MSYYLGVDLGTTYTAAAVWRDGHVEITGLGNRAPTIPSVVLLRDDGSMLVGEAAERRAVVEPHRVAREFKRRIGDPTPIVIGGTPYSADALTAKVLRWVVDKVTETEGGAPTGVAITYPANWGNYKTDLLRQAITLADLDRVDTVTEPEAAAIHYASQERVEQGSVIAVYDLGGGTFDAAVLRKTATGWDILGEPQGVERLGGVDFDEAVFQHVVATLDGAVERLDPDDATALAAVARLRFECVDAKEALSTDTEVTIPVLLPNVQTEVRLTRRELEAMVRPALEGSITALDRAIRLANVKTEDVTTILLVGGSSRAPLVSELVSSELARPLAVDAHPKYSVALGAAVVAAGHDVADAVDRSQIGAIPEEPSPIPPAMPIGPAGMAGAAGAYAGASMAPTQPAPTQPMGPSAAPPPPGGPTGPPTGPPAGPPTMPIGGSPYQQGPIPSGGYPAAGGQSSGGYPAAGGYSSGGYGTGGYAPAGQSGGYPQSGGGGGSKTGLWLAIGGIAAVLIVVLVVALGGGGDGDDPPGTTTTTEFAGTTTTDFTSTTDFDSTTGSTIDRTTADGFMSLLVSCSDGSMADCDSLWGGTPSGSQLEAFAETCGYRDIAGGHNASCVEDFGADGAGATMATTSTSTAEYAADQASCLGGDMAACDNLYVGTPSGSMLDTMANTCGGLVPNGTHSGDCEETYG